ncbi:MAG: gamma-glutamyltransferase family protein [Bacteroidota bacterium]
MKKVYIFCLVALFLINCQKEQPEVSSDIEKSEQLFSQTASSKNGMISAAHPLAVKAGVEIMEKGGNAVDAAVASAFALSVVEPSMSGLGGRLQALIRLPNGEFYGIDATTQAPWSYDAETAPEGKYGYATIGIPGVVAGLCKLLEKHGTLPLQTVIQPAINYAENGFTILPREAKRQALAHQELTEFTGSTQYFLKADSSNYQAGELVVQKDLAQTLRKIATEGKDAFYKGEIAQKIVADIQANGGVLKLEDLANYKAKDAQLLRGDYRGYTLHGLGIPSYGAITIQILQILENLPLHELKDADWASAVYQAMGLAYKDRKNQFSDSLNILLDKTYAAKLAKEIDRDVEDLKDAAYNFNSIPESWLADVGHTTHLSTADKDGMMVALTQSLGPNMGSKVASPGLGFLYAVTLGGYLGDFEPGQRAASHICPFIITKEGKPFMVLGAAGGSRIVTAVTSVSSRVIDHQMPLADALAAPRVHPDEDSVFVEMHEGWGWKDEVVEALEAQGFGIKEVPDIARFGRVHAIMYDSLSSEWIGAADPDWEGAVGSPE